MVTHQCLIYCDSQLQRCIGSAVIAMGPEKMLSVVPISLHPNNFSSSNVWLVPILRDYVVGSSLEYYMDYIVPLAKSFKRASSGGMSSFYMTFVSVIFIFQISYLTS